MCKIIYFLVKLKENTKSAETQMRQILLFRVILTGVRCVSDFRDSDRRVLKPQTCFLMGG